MEVQSPTKFLHKGLGIRRTILTKKHRTDQFSPINLTVFLLRPFKPNIDLYVRNKQHSFLPEPFKQRLSFLRPFWLHELRTSPCLFGKSSIHPQRFSHYHLGHTINAMFFSPNKIVLNIRFSFIEDFQTSHSSHQNKNGLKVGGLKLASRWSGVGIYSFLMKMLSMKLS